MLLADSPDRDVRGVGAVCVRGVGVGRAVMPTKPLPPPPSGPPLVKGRRPLAGSPGYGARKKHRPHAKPQLDFPALLELQATLGCPPVELTERR